MRPVCGRCPPTRFPGTSLCADGLPAAKERHRNILASGRLSVSLSTDRVSVAPSAGEAAALRWTRRSGASGRRLLSPSPEFAGGWRAVLALALLERGYLARMSAVRTNGQPAWVTETGNGNDEILERHQPQRQAPESGTVR